MTPYYEDDAVTIYHANCWQILDVVEADAVITDPPYGCGVKYATEDYDDAAPTYWDDFRSTQRALVAKFAPVVFTHRVKALQELSGWDWVGVWNKPWSSGVRVGNSPVLPHWEPIFMYGIQGLGVHNSYTSDVLSVNPQPASAGIRGREGWAVGEHEGHPCPKPLSLMVALVAAFSKIGQTVFDPFMGSGTTLRAAKDTGRKAIGCDLSERYCELAAKRLGQEVLDFGASA